MTTQKFTINRDLAFIGYDPGSLFTAFPSHTFNGFSYRTPGAGDHSAPYITNNIIANRNLVT